MIRSPWWGALGRNTYRRRVRCEEGGEACVDFEVWTCRSSRVAEVRQKGVTRYGISASMADLGSSLRESSTPFAIRENPDLGFVAPPPLPRDRAKGAERAEASML